jgi:hypothetical protein
LGWADLVCIALFFAAVGSLMAVLTAVVRGRQDRALHILIRLAIAAGIYLLAVLTVSWSTRPQTSAPANRNAMASGALRWRALIGLPTAEA